MGGAPRAAHARSGRSGATHHTRQVHVGTSFVGRVLPATPFGAEPPTRAPGVAAAAASRRRDPQRHLDGRHPRRPAGVLGFHRAVAVRRAHDRPGGSDHRCEHVRRRRDRGLADAAQPGHGTGGHPRAPVGWLLVFGPIGMVATVAFTALSGAAWIWPWVLASLVALLGAAAGLVPLVSLFLPLPCRNGAAPIRWIRVANPRTTGALIAQGVVMTFLPPLFVVPAIGAALLGYGVSPASPGSDCPSASPRDSLPRGRLAPSPPTGWQRAARSCWSGCAPDRCPADHLATAHRVPASAWVAVEIGSVLLFPRRSCHCCSSCPGQRRASGSCPCTCPRPSRSRAIVGFGALGLAAYGVAWRISRTAARRSGRTRAGRMRAGRTASRADRPR